MTYLDYHFEIFRKEYPKLPVAAAVMSPPPQWVADFLTHVKKGKTRWRSGTFIITFKKNATRLLSWCYSVKKLPSSRSLVGKSYLSRSPGVILAKEQRA